MPTEATTRRPVAPHRLDPYSELEERRRTMRDFDKLSPELRAILRELPIDGSAAMVFIGLNFRRDPAFAAELRADAAALRIETRPRRVRR